MKRFFSSILLFICLASSASAFELSPHTATYSANIKKGIKIKGKAVRELKRLDESTWHYSFDVRSFAADIDESVTFSLLDDRITPEKYRYKFHRPSKQRWKHTEKPEMYWERELIGRVFPRQGVATKEILKDYIYDML